MALRTASGNRRTQTLAIESKEDVMALRTASGNTDKGFSKKEEKRGGPPYCGPVFKVEYIERGILPVPAGGYIVVSAYSAGDGKGKDENKISALISAKGAMAPRYERITARNDGGEIAVGLASSILQRGSIPRNIVGKVMALLDAKDLARRAGGDVLSDLNEILAEGEVPENKDK